MRARLAGAVGSALLVALLGACSQVAALKPVSGMNITGVRIAIYDVLVAEKIDVLVAPVCTTVADGFTCTGSTVDGREIVGTAGSTAPMNLTLEVGGAVIYDGAVQDVLDRAAEEAS